MTTCFIGVVVGGPGVAVGCGAGAPAEAPPPDEEQAVIDTATNIGKSQRGMPLPFPS